MHQFAGVQAALRIWDFVTIPQIGKPNTLRSEVDMSRTDKDTREERLQHWQSVYIPSRWNRAERRRQRTRAAQDMQNGREPQPDYGDIYYW